MIRLHAHETNQIATIRRDVSHNHPAWVHEQLGTSSEVELQSVLDGINVSEFYGAKGHRGPDENGLEMFHDDLFYIVCCGGEDSNELQDRDYAMGQYARVYFTSREAAEEVAEELAEDVGEVVDESCVYSVSETSGESAHKHWTIR